MQTLVNRPTLDDMELGLGKRVRLHRMLHEHGPGGSTLLVLPVDQGLEHGPRDFFDNADSLDPAYELELAAAAGYSAIALQIGLASKYMKPYAGRVPLILKINGKTDIPSANAPRSPLNARVEDAVRLGADSIGYTLYVGSKQQDNDFETFSQVRREAEQAGMPVVVWAYPRGEDIGKKGGSGSIYAIDYAARVASELGADVVKVNYPDGNEDGSIGPVVDAPAPYNSITWTMEEALSQILKSAGKTMVIMSGGSRVSDKLLLDRVDVSLRAGVTGFIFGRNIWQRPHADAIAVAAQIKKRMQRYAKELG